MSLLVISEILALFVNIFTADHKYYLCNRENLQQSNQVQLSQKQKVLCEIFALFLKSTSNFELFFKKEDPHGQGHKLLSYSFNTLTEIELENDSLSDI